MKGLLLKDLYMLRAYCKSYLLIIVVFLAASFFGENTFFIYYPCLLCGMIPVNLLAYDEQSRFMQYSVSLPVGKATVVNEKYLIGLLSQVTVLFLTGISHGIRMAIEGSFVFSEFVIIIVSLLLVSMLASAIPLPLIFKNGVEKGRIAYYVMIGVVCGAGAIFSQLFQEGLKISISAGLLFAILAFVGISIYLLSWYLSKRFYQKREL